STEIYALIAVLGTYILFGLYLSWAFLPVNWLEKIGWSWFPSQEWAIVVPCWMMLCVLLTYWSYAALMAYNTPPFDSLRSFTDPFAKIPPKSSSPEDSFAEEAVDLPIDLVNRILY
ncbi:hypothetical protein TREMEDRAFT_23916, partial [Tremella mesenterica DSM 1558]|uniref:uncharacterized protein n=1 Tax=Tremella mesenterica (strain ATCC 24925 / CBS 8224 / DSM 1558 / NBRC 9311 / NRRL Y-6157 / RJB 2259-6 / UBC 559-6) TaxID=578456 RepID=UPI0003F48D3D